MKKKAHNKFLAKEYEKKVKQALYSITGDISSITADSKEKEYQLGQACSVKKLEKISCKNKDGTILSLLGEGAVGNIIDSFQEELSRRKER